MENKYQNGKIYKLTSIKTDKIYIGSTTRTLNQRLIIHRSKCNNTNSHLITEFKDFKIELIENYPCNTKRELLLREAHFIRLLKNKCVNKVIPCRTGKQYYEDNKESFLVNSKNYKLENKEIVNKKKAIFRENNRERIREDDRQWYSKNKDKLKLKRDENKEEINKKNREKYRKKNPKKPLKCKELIKKEKKEYDINRRFWINSFGGRIDLKSYNNNLLHISIDVFH